MKRLGRLLFALALAACVIACVIAVTPVFLGWFSERAAWLSGGDPKHPGSQSDATGDVSAPAADWPMFHGDAALTGVTAASIPDKPELLWTFKSGDQITGSATIAGQRVFFGSADFKVYALNLKDGAKLWEFKTEGAIESTPCVVGDVLFIGSGDQQLYALDARTGALRWRYATEGEIKAGPNFVSGAALGLAPPPHPTLSPQGRGQDEGGRVLVGSYDNKLHCVDAATGKAAWTFETGNYVNGCAAIGAGKTVFGGCDAQLHIVDVKTGEETARVGVGAYVAASPALRDGIAYVGHYDSELLAVDIQKAAVLWRFKNPHDFPFFSSPAVAQDRLVVGARDKRVHCLERATGKELWSFSARGKVDSSPAIARDRVIAGSEDGRVYILALQDGKELWSYDIGSSVDGSPAVSDGLFIVGADDGVLYAFGDKKSVGGR